MGELGEEEEAEASGDGLTVPGGVPALHSVHYLHGLFPETFLAELDELRAVTPVFSGSHNMYASRRFLRCEALAKRVLSFLPERLGLTHVLSDMRFIEYPPGGHILPHVDGVRVDDVTAQPSTTSMLLFTETVPEGEGGETEFLEFVDEEGTEGKARVLFGARPVRGSILLFPHDVPHRGQFVGAHPKILLRGDLY